MAGATRLELATSGVTGRRSNRTELHPRKPVYVAIVDAFDLPALPDRRSSNRMVGGTGLEPVTLGL